VRRRARRAGLVRLPAGRGPRPVRRRVLLAGLVAAAAGLLAGCGVGAGKGPGDVSLTVTNGFGSRPVGQPRTVQAPGGETIMRLLQRSYQVTTRYGGGFVQSIDGRRGGTEAGRPVDWFFYVNGIEASKGAAATKLHPGDRVWWDRHDWSAAMRVPAVVGSFPEPFRSGIDGRRLPVRVECERTGAPACDEARRRLSAAGVPAGSAVLGAQSQGRIARVLVGRWPAVRRNPEVRLVEEGPARSGVFARFDREGRTLAVLNPDGRPIRTLGPGAGLVAATRPPEEGQEEAVTWVVTGTDDRGVLAAARALEEGALGDHFAVAIDPGGIAVPLPAVSAQP